MTDYLAKIAAKTVECVEEHSIAMSRTNMKCKGSSRVLDSRFEKLRETRCLQDRQHRMMYHSSTPSNCPGYTVVQSLEILLDTARPLLYGMMLTLDSRDSRPDGWYCVIEEKMSGICHTHDGVYHTPLEAAAHAIYDWLEAQEQEVTG